MRLLRTIVAMAVSTTAIVLLPGTASGAPCHQADTTTELVYYVNSMSGCVDLMGASDPNVIKEYVIDDRLVLMPGETINGIGPYPRNIVIKASSTFPVGPQTSVVWLKGGVGNPARLYNLTIDASSRSVIGTHGYNAMIDHVWVINAVCNGITMGAGANFTVSWSVIRYNGTNTASPACTAPPGAAIYVNGDSTDGIVIDNNHIEYNIGPAIDINKVDGPSTGWNYIVDNQISGNSGWGAVSLYSGSRWWIEGNYVTHPKTSEIQPYNSECTNFPSNGPVGSAAMFVCEADQDSGVTYARNNYISHNTFIGRYGMLLTGVNTSTDVPKDNSLYANDVYGSSYGCADAYTSGQTNSNRYNGVTDTSRQCYYGNVGYF